MIIKLRPIDGDSWSKSFKVQSLKSKITTEMKAYLQHGDDYTLLQKQINPNF